MLPDPGMCDDLTWSETWQEFLNSGGVLKVTTSYLLPGIHSFIKLSR